MFGDAQYVIVIDCYEISLINETNDLLIAMGNIILVHCWQLYGVYIKQWLIVHTSSEFVDV